MTYSITVSKCLQYDYNFLSHTQAEQRFLINECDLHEDISRILLFIPLVLDEQFEYKKYKFRSIEIEEEITLPIKLTLVSNFDEVGEYYFNILLNIDKEVNKAILDKIKDKDNFFEEIADEVETIIDINITREEVPFLWISNMWGTLCSSAEYAKIKSREINMKIMPWVKE